MLEYALPKHDYFTLHWPNRAVYYDHGLRLEDLQHSHLIEGSYSPMSYTVSLLAYGKIVTESQGRSGILAWDAVKETFGIKNISSTINALVVQATEDLLQDSLMHAARCRLQLSEGYYDKTSTRMVTS